MAESAAALYVVPHFNFFLNSSKEVELFINVGRLCNTWGPLNLRVSVPQDIVLSEEIENSLSVVSA